VSALHSDGAAYPEPLKQAEEKLLDARHGGAGRGRPTGVALSGGGIRSAIFALGLFQTLAKKGLLRRVDYLSTVSGGGYFGGFFTALFSRPDYAEVKSVEDALRAESEPLRYLRRNGRYLAPAGTHDLLLGLSVLLRNWLTVLAMTVALLMSAFLALEWLPHFVRDTFGLDGIWQLAQLGFVERFAFERGVWLSGWLLPSAAILIGVAVPLGWAYFTLGRPGPSTDGRWSKVRDALKPGVALSHAVLVALGLQLHGSGQGLLGPFPLKVWGAALIGLTLLTAASAMAAELWIVVWAACSNKRQQGDRFWRWIAMPIAFGLGCLASALPVVLVGEITRTGISNPYLLAAANLMLLWVLAMLVRGLVSTIAKRAAAISAVNLDQFPRHTVSSWLKTWLVAAGALVLFALIQSAGRTLYAQMHEDLGWVLSSLGAALASAAGFAKRLVVKLGEKPDGKRSRGFPAVFQYAAGGLVAAAVLVGTSAGAACVTYGDSSLLPRLGELIAQPTQWGEPQVLEVAEVAERAGTWALVLVGVSLMFGFSRRLLNNSTHSPLYSARITRTFLGASNSQRTGSARDEDDVQRGAATHLMRDDDITLAEYFRHPQRAPKGKAESPPKASPYEKGAPLHLINVTINETVDGRSGMHEPDAKGIGLAVGPCGLSAGVRHHAVFAWGQRKPPKIFPEQAEYRVFQYAPSDPGPLKKLLERPHSFPYEQLSLGQWLGVSGAAFTTGLGWRTNAGLSFLAGITNIRLGHWWRPGIWRRLTATRILGVLFWVQQYLAREFFARFPGTANSLWYLSDGGHFENTGAYELIRRKAELILLVDAEADPTYEFEGLAHLVRKARVDFGAEIRFLTREDAEFGDLIHVDVLDRFGSLDELRRGSWKRDVRFLKNGADVPRLDEHGFTLDEVSLEALSRANAALAVIDYRDAPPGYLVYIKPTLTGAEPIDVARYHTEHPSFPQETTGDQFFDEAQWESYRKLGEHIGEGVFAAGWPIAVRTPEEAAPPRPSDPDDKADDQGPRPDHPENAGFRNL
jgi:hypothetical protein